ncbi:MAG: alpha/beta fold hydrolase [Pirellulaceae bacterium]|nr:alpha/beta fold hydrolase [Planctomycetaceae bacterium]HIM30795.1 alpha/beta fold hydrolase [Planctomycetota bacterium]
MKFLPTFILILTALFATSSARSQDEEKKLKIAVPKPISLTTRDSVILRCKYYPGGVIRVGSEESIEFEEIKGKDVMPLILLHGHEEQGSVYDEFAKRLQSMGHAVIVPDLRGHGGSKTTTFNIQLDASKMKARDFASLVNDIDAVKKFLLKENNESKLNIELLTVVGAEMGASAAILWARKDWSLPQLVGFKQGRDVKALILLSPQMNFNGLGIKDAILHPIVRVMPMFITYGNKGSKGREAKKSVDQMTRQLERYHKADPTSLRVISSITSLQGTALLLPRGPVPDQTIKFIEKQILSKSSLHPWTDRSGPLEDKD